MLRDIHAFYSAKSDAGPAVGDATNDGRPVRGTVNVKRGLEQVRLSSRSGLCRAARAAPRRKEAPIKFLSQQDHLTQQQPRLKAAHVRRTAFEFQMETIIAGAHRERPAPR